MASDDTRSVQDIRRDTERTREGLTTSVNQLREAVTETASDLKERLSPQAIKSEVTGYVRSRGEELFDTVSEAARRNPVHAVAVGAGIAYPLLRIARSIPLPVWLIGAGIFFTSSSKGQELSRQAADAASDVTDTARRKVHDLRDQLGEAASGSRSYAAETASQIADSVSTAVESVRGTLTGFGDSVGEQARSATEMADGTAASLSARASGAGAAVADTVRGLGSNATAAITELGDKTSGAIDAGREYVSETGARLAQTGANAGRKFLDAVDQNPLIAAGFAMMIGGLIASALPKLDVEDDLMGKASDDVRRRATDAASATFDTAKSAATEVISQVSKKAEEEGLSPAGLASSIQDVGERLKHVAERGITTAFEPHATNDPQSHSKVGEKDNG
jgi:ElaB/YqjD/DUF883 family membrane-anchored ribosome-binding protein